jgi:magnesium transporter
MNELPPAVAACLVGERAGFRWFHVEDTKGPVLDALAAHFGLHELAVEDCRHIGQRAKVEEYEGHVFIVANAIHFDKDKLGCWLGEVNFFVGKDFLISIREGPSRTFAATLPKFKADAKLAHSGRLLMTMLDFMVDQYLPVLDAIEDKIEELEEQVLADPSPQLLARIFGLRRALIDYRRAAMSMREVLNHLLYRTEPWYRSQQAYFRNVYDHVVRALDFVETYRDILNGVLDVHLSATANRTNDVMKVLTVFATLATPMLLITSFYGMNFEHLPLLHEPRGALIATAGMLLISLAMLAYFRQKRWI